MDASYSTNVLQALHFETDLTVLTSRGHTMPLTPADVHNVAFSKPPIGKRGYNEDEVDAFLDLVENELTRLIEENTDLRQRVAEHEQELAAARAGGAAQPTQSLPVYKQPEPEPVAPVAPVIAPVVAAPAAPSAPVSEDHHVRAAKVLSLAQDTADRLTGSAKAEADKLLSDARAQADALVSQAKKTAETTVADAKKRADTTLADAQTRSDTQLRQAQEKADALQADAERKHTEIMGNINQQRGVLEGRLDQLRTFEREYRTRLKTYLESQLEELGQRGSAAPAESAATGEGAGFNQFNRGNNS
jgi:DivIVA domain-containing protein